MRIREFTAFAAALLVVSPALAGDRVHTMTGMIEKFNNPTASIQRNMLNQVSSLGLGLHTH